MKQNNNINRALANIKRWHVIVFGIVIVAFGAKGVQNAMFDEKVKEFEKERQVRLEKEAENNRAQAILDAEFNRYFYALPQEYLTKRYFGWSDAEYQNSAKKSLTASEMAWIKHVMRGDFMAEKAMESVRAWARREGIEVIVDRAVDAPAAPVKAEPAKPAPVRTAAAAKPAEQPAGGLNMDAIMAEIEECGDYWTGVDFVNYIKENRELTDEELTLFADYYRRLKHHARAISDLEAIQELEGMYFENVARAGHAAR